MHFMINTELFTMRRQPKYACYSKNEVRVRIEHLIFNFLSQDVSTIVFDYCSFLEMDDEDKFYRDDADFEKLDNLNCKLTYEEKEFGFADEFMLVEKQGQKCIFINNREALQLVTEAPKNHMAKVIQKVKKEHLSNNSGGTCLEYANNRVYILSSHHEDDDEYNTYLTIYDIETNKYVRVQVHDFPIDRTMFAYNNRILVYPNEDEYECYAYDMYNGSDFGTLCKPPVYFRNIGFLDGFLIMETENRRKHWIYDPTLDEWLCCPRVKVEFQFDDSLDLFFKQA